MGIDRAVPVAVPAHILSGTAMMNQPGNLHNPHDPPDQPSEQAAPKPIQRQFQRRSLTGLRLQKHADYQRAYNASRKRQSVSMSWFLAPRQPQPDQGGNPSPRVGLTAGKVLGKAHERNRIKRRMREALRLHTALLPQGCDLILHPRRSVLSLDFAKLEAEVMRILQQARAEATRGFAPTPSSHPGKHPGPAKPAL